MYTVPVMDKIIREQFLPYALPTIGEEEIAEVADSLRSGWVTTGPKVKQFEEQLADYVDSKNVVAVNSCTAGLHIALTALGVGPGDEIIVPTLTFCSSANVVVHLGAKPILVDVGEDCNVTPEVIEAAITAQTKAIMVVHYGGQACHLEAMYELAVRYNLPIIEDAAHAVGTRYHGHRIGADALQQSWPTLQRVTVFSFYATKNMTTGEGGAIATADGELADEMRILTLHGMSKDAWKRYTNAGSWYYEVVTPGYKSNMTDIQAALGIHQLRKLDAFLETRQRYAALYDQGFSDVAEVETPIYHTDRNHVFHLYPIRLNLDLLQIDRAAFIDELRERNIGTSVHFIPVHMHPFYSERFGYQSGDLPLAQAIYERIVSLPLYPKMTETDIHDVIQIVRQILITNRR